MTQAEQQSRGQVEAHWRQEQAKERQRAREDRLRRDLETPAPKTKPQEKAKEPEQPKKQESKKPERTPEGGDASYRGPVTLHTAHCATGMLDVTPDGRSVFITWREMAEEKARAGESIEAIKTFEDRDINRGGDPTENKRWYAELCERYNLKSAKAETKNADLEALPPLMRAIVAQNRASLERQSTTSQAPETERA